MSSQLNQTHFSVLDLATVREGKTIADTYENSVKLAQHVGNWVIKDIGWRNIIIWKALPALQHLF